MLFSRIATALFVGAILIGAPVQAEILFEAYYRVEKKGRHTGYVIQRLSTDKKGEKTLRTYFRTKGPKQDYFVQVKSSARSGSGQPVETSHYSNVTGGSNRIHTRFRNGKGTVQYYSNNSRKAGLSKKVIYPQTPSAFLFYIADLSKLKTNYRHPVRTLLEDEGQSQLSYLTLLSAKENSGSRVMHLLFDDSAQPIENFVSESGHPLGSRSMATDSVVYWVAKKEDAVGEFTFSTGEITSFFGDLPAGKKNPWTSLKSFDALSAIQQFPAWTGARPTGRRSLSSSSPLPLRKL